MDKRTKRLLQQHQQEVQLAVINNVLQNHRLPCAFCGGRVAFGGGAVFVTADEITWNDA